MTIGDKAVFEKNVGRSTTRWPALFYEGPSALQYPDGSPRPRMTPRPEGPDEMTARPAKLALEDGTVVFKAEVACASPYAAQIQGVYVQPDRRGEGLATRGMAAVVDIVRREIAPTVSLYVNEWNAPARAAYERVGFRQTATFSTVMF